MSSKRYYWMKLKDDFFEEKYISALRRMDEGEKRIIVLLKIQLYCLNTEGVFNFEGYMPDIYSELAMVINEDEDITGTTVEAMIKFGKMKLTDGKKLEFIGFSDNVGSESESAGRTRTYRAAKKQASQCDKAPSQCDIEKEREKDKEKDTEKDKEKTLPEGRGDCDEKFEKFWSCYPKKTAKVNAKKVWDKINPDDKLFDRLISAVDSQKLSAQWQKEKGRYIPYPATWLTERRWEDESEAVTGHSFNIKDYECLVNRFT